jgi:DNA-binding LacI/PurR family transcriptional regulator
MRTVTEVDIASERLVREFSDQGCCSVLLPWLGKGKPSGLHDFVRASELPVVLPDPVHGLEDHFYRKSEVDRNTSLDAIVTKGFYFRSLGYRKIALLGSKTKTSTDAMLRYINWVNQEKIPNLLEVVEDGCRDFDGTIDRWLSFGGELAVIACDDVLALDFMDACKKRGLAVPDEFAVMGQGNHPDGFRSDPPLSNALYPYDCIADGMISYALSLSRGSSERVQQDWPLVFQIRESCGARLKRGNQDNTGAPPTPTLHWTEQEITTC